MPILSFTDLPGTRSRNALIWGVQTYLVPRGETTDQLMAILDDVLIGEELATLGDRVVVTAGAPPGIAGSTNNVRMHIVGAGAAETLP